MAVTIDPALLLMAIGAFFAWLSFKSYELKGKNFEEKSMFGSFENVIASMQNIFFFIGILAIVGSVIITSEILKPSSPLLADLFDQFAIVGALLIGLLLLCFAVTIWSYYLVGLNKAATEFKH